MKFFVVLLSTLFAFISLASASNDTNTIEYILVGVSGGLQDGFPEHTRLDYMSGSPEEEVQAIFLGRALVRGYKAFLDVMQPEWRQYVPEPDQPLINSNVFASGCYEHANEYWIYLVDSRQVLTVLQNEPRFLSITPDTGQLELQANETSVCVKGFIQYEIKQQSKTNLQYAAVPLVTAVWFQPESHVPSPPIRKHDDGTQITNFPDSLAIWANVNDANRTAMIDSNCDDNDDECVARAQQAEQRYWDGIRQAVRTAEKNRPSPRKAAKYGPPFKCKKKVRFGVDSITARINYPFSAQKVKQSLESLGYNVDFENGEVHPMIQEEEGSKTEL